MAATYSSYSSRPGLLPLPHNQPTAASHPATGLKCARNPPFRYCYAYPNIPKYPISHHSACSSIVQSRPHFAIICSILASPAVSHNARLAARRIHSSDPAHQDAAHNAFLLSKYPPPLYISLAPADAYALGLRALSLPPPSRPCL